MDFFLFLCLNIELDNTNKLKFILYIDNIFIIKKVEINFELAKINFILKKGFIILVKTNSNANKSIKV